jgi:holliday junction DNA helicase RuvB
MSNQPESFIESSLKREDEQFEVTLRPQALDDFAGQHAIKERLAVVITAARQRNEPLGHCIFSGPPGLGKTTLANILAKSMGTRLVVTSGPVIEKPAELAGILTSLKEGEILFIDEIHRLNRVVEEYLYPAMEDFVLDLMIDSGPNARSVQLKLNRFTLVGATTRMGMLSAPLRSRFTFSGRLDYYEPEVLQKIVKRSADIMNLTLDEEGAFEVARRSRGTPRIANNLLRWVRDYAQIRARGVINKEVADKALSMLAIDQDGLDETDKRLLSVLIDHYGGGPVGVNTLAVAMGEEPSTLEEVHEPFLILQGLIKRTPRGREATARAYQSLGREML